jgi:hypothetical protein
MSKFKGTQLSFFFSFLRTLGFHMLFATFWGMWAYLVLNTALSWALFLWALLIGPAFFLILLTLRRPYLAQAFERVDFKKYPVLTKEYFRSLLKIEGPYPVLLSYRSPEVAYAWLEHPFRAEQVLLVSEGFLKQDPKELRFYWEHLWSSIARTPRELRWLRSVEWSLWMANGLPLALCVRILEIALDVLKLNAVPKASFWMQRWCWSLRFLWFPHQQESDPEDLPLSSPNVRAEQNFVAPSPWDRLLWGVWFKVANQRIHPLWKILTHSDAFLPNPR